MFSPDGQQVLTSKSALNSSAASSSDGQQVLTSSAGMQALSGSRGMDDPEGDLERDLEEHLKDEDQLQDSAIHEEPEALREDPITCSFIFHCFTPSGTAVWDVPLCPRCQASEETTFHQLWECPHNSNIQGTHLELLEEARAGHSEFPCFWLRGLPPLCARTYPYCMLATDSRMEFSGGRPSQPIVLPPGAVVGADGSG